MTCFRLYARHQTDPHVVPAATGGIVPKGDHNDVDMRVGLPPNCVHLTQPKISLTCRKLGVDFAVRPPLLPLSGRSSRSRAHSAFALFVLLRVCRKR
jgi:hypothetical protein